MSLVAHRINRHRLLYPTQPKAILALVATLAATVLGLSSTPARAITFRLCECTATSPYPSPGTELTLGFRIDGAPGEQIFGLGASAYGYSEGVMDFVRGEAVSSIFHAVVIPSVGAFEGLSNTVVPAAPGQFTSGPLSESSIGASGNRVQIFNGVDLRTRSFNPLDPGLDGIAGGDGAQVRVTFRFVGAGVTNLYIGTGYNGDGAVYAGGRTDTSSNLSLPIGGMDVSSLCAIPEPGTALCLGLGLAALAGRRGAIPGA